MIKFIKNKEPGYCSLITFWQLVKALGMDYNEFKSKLWFNTPDEKFIREIWNKIVEGKTTFETLEKDFFEKKLDGGKKSLFDYIDEFNKVVYKAQTGIPIDFALNNVKTIHDKISWDEDKLIDTYEKFFQTVPAVPFLTETFCFDGAKKFHKPEHIYITTIEKKIPGGPWTIINYDNDEDGPYEYLSKHLHEPINYLSAGDDTDESQ